MFAENIDQSFDTKDFQMGTLLSLPIAIDILADGEIGYLASEMSPSIPWADRQAAAIKLGQSLCPEATQILLARLQDDPFWMVRCTIIQVLESLGDGCSIPILHEVAANDEFTAVRSAAEMAIERLSG